MGRAVSRILAAAGLAAAMAACSNTNTTTVTPTPTPTLVTESFSGDLQTGGANVHTFAASKGITTGVLTSLSPLSTAHLGMSLGVYDGKTCSVVATNDTAAVLSTVVGTAAEDNLTLCFRVYDVGNIPPDSTYSYTATVTHY